MSFSSYNAPQILGEFREAEYKNWFNYACRDSDDDVAFAPEFPHLIFLENGETRFARIVKTRAYVVVDEGADGAPVTETWIIQNHNRYVA